MRTFELFAAKTTLKFMVCQQCKLHTRGLRQCKHFADKGTGINCFAILYGRLLWTFPNPI